MNTENAPPPASPPREQPQKEKTSGEGADTAMRALIRKRRQVEGPDEPPPGGGDPKS
jgi:hypothetical protein